MIAEFFDLTNRRIDEAAILSTSRVEERKTSMYKWQSRWENCLKGRCTFHFVKFHLAKYPSPWMENKHCELNYYVTQFLTGHGRFRKYLHRFGRELPQYAQIVSMRSYSNMLSQTQKARGNEFWIKPSNGRGLEFQDSMEPIQQENS